MDIKNELLDILCDYVDVAKESIDTSEPLKFASGLDSFVLFSFVSAIEDHFNIVVPGEKLRSFDSLDDIIAYLESVLNK